MDENKKIILAALVVIFGGNAGHLIGAVDPNKYRPDPFTGLDGARLEARTIERDQAMRGKINRLEWEIKECIKRLDILENRINRG